MVELKSNLSTDADEFIMSPPSDKQIEEYVVAEEPVIVEAKEEEIPVPEMEIIEKPEEIQEEPSVIEETNITIENNIINTIDNNNSTVENDNIIENNNTIIDNVDIKTEETIVEPEPVVVENEVELDDNKNLVETTATVAKPEAKTVIPEKSKSLIEYDPDQWSPENPDGRKKYSRSQLFQLKETPIAKEKPSSIPDSLENILIRAAGAGGNYQQKEMNQYMNKNNFGDSLLPKFASGANNNLNTGPNRHPYTKRPSGQG